MTLAVFLRRAGKDVFLLHGRPGIAREDEARITV